MSYNIENSMQKTLKIKDFITKRIVQIDNSYQHEDDLMSRLKLSSMRTSFANILNVYLNEDKEIGSSYLKHAKIYMQANCYQQAVHYAQMAIKKLKDQGLIEECQMICVNAYIQMNKTEEAHDLLKQIQPDNQKQKYYEYKALVMQKLKNEKATFQCLERLQELIVEKCGKMSAQMGLFLITKGKTIGYFEKYRQALVLIHEGMNTLIEIRYKNHIEIGKVYLIMAEYNKLIGDLQAQYTSLICAYSMFKQDKQKVKEMIDIQHKIASNLLNQQDYDSALKQLFKIETLEKHLYGQSSHSVAKTIKTIAETLSKSNRKHEAKKYELEFSRIISCNDKKAGNRQKPLIYSRLKSSE